MELFYNQLLFCCFVSFFTTYIAGHVLLSFIKTSIRFPFAKEFTKLCVGFYAITTAYSIFKTNGITINLGLLLLFFGLCIWLQRNKYLRPKNEILAELISTRSLPYIGIQLLILVLVFVFLLFKINNPINETIYQVYGDFYNYAKIIEHLNRTGIEGGFADWYSGAIPVRNLYHFGELWYAAFFSSLTKQTPFNVFYFQLFSICLITYFLGACALIELFIQPQDKKVYIISIAVLFICGISFYIPRTSIFTKGDWWDNSLLFQPKYFFSAIFIFYAFILSKKKIIMPLVFIGMATILVCTVVAPAILISVGLIVLLLFVSKKISFIDAIKFSIPIIVTLLFIGCYTLWIHYLNDLNAIEKPVAISQNSSPAFAFYIKTAFNCFAGQMIKSMLSLLPFVMVFFLWKRKQLETNSNIRNLIVVFFILHVSSILSYAIFFNRVDAVQLWTNIYVPLSAIICFLMVAYIVNYKNIFFRIAVLVLIGFSFIQARIIRREEMINKQYVTNLLHKYDGKEAVFFKSKEDFTSVFSKNINMYVPSPYLVMNYNAYNPTCLTVFEIPKSNIKILRDTEEEIIENAVFYRFVQLQKKNNQFVSVEQSQLDFIKKYKIKYAFVYLHSALPSALQPHVESIIIDTTSGIKFYTLKKID